jgi:hypothetical protein
LIDIHQHSEEQSERDRESEGENEQSDDSQDDSADNGYSDQQQTNDEASYGSDGMDRDEYD